MSLEANLRGVHPVLAFRIRRLLAEPSLSKYGTYPAVRDRAKQQAFYAKYKAGKGPLAANPDRKLRTGPSFPYPWTPRGSWHMVQGDGYGHAVDLKRPWNRTRAQARAEVHPYLARHGLMATVRSEWWHVQSLTSQGWVDGPMPSGSEDLLKQKPADPLVEAAKFVNACKKTVVRLGDAGSVVTFLQTHLDKHGHRLTRKGKPGQGIDGIFGKMTDQAVRDFQRAEGLTVDGIVGPATWGTLVD